MGRVSIGEFSRLSRLSPKALRLYDELGLLVPDHVDATTGYRWYADTQLDQARLVALLDLSGDTRQMASMDQSLTPAPLRCGIVLHVQEDACQILRAGQLSSVRFANPFPSPRTERVSPGHLVAVTAAADGAEAVVWRWYDAVVLGEETGLVRLWEPAHGEVVGIPAAPSCIDSPELEPICPPGCPAPTGGSPVPPWRWRRMPTSSWMRSSVLHRAWSVAGLA